MGKTQIKDLTRKFNLRTPVCKRIKSNEETKVKRRKKQTSFTNLDLGQILQKQKTCLSWLNGKRISRRNSRRLNRLIPINERKVILKRKSDQKSRSGIIAENPRKRKMDEQANERIFAVCG